MDLRRSVPFALAVSALVPACNPYHNRGGEFLAGSVDPNKFPAAFQGPGYTKGQGFGSFAPVAANGGRLAYYSFPFNQMAGGPIAPGTLLTASDSDMTATFLAPLAYVFDPSPPTSPFPAKPACVVPPNYVFDERRDAYRLDEQGAIFTELPDLTGQISSLSGAAYAPIVSEITVKSAGEPCNDPKSAETLVSRTDVMFPNGLNPAPVGQNTFPFGKLDAPPNFLAWAIIDPSAEVLNPDGTLNPTTGLGPQKWGWFDHFLLAYIDGGYIPTMMHTVPGMNGAPDTQVTELVPQIMYVPDTIPDGMGGVMPGTPGAGNDILQFARTDAGYSPLCHIIMYTPTDPTMLETEFSQVTAAEVKTDNNQYIACLQVQ
ncbi:MAG TPA: hypothetical protein VFF06_18305 [Polyangia bacterium]|nr:hypothetical protein [Polyangia bacterium]